MSKHGIINHLRRNPTPSMLEQQAPPPPPSNEVLAMYGKTDEIARVMTLSAEAIRQTGQKLADESKAALQAARDMLRMFESEQEQFQSEVLRHSANVAERLSGFLSQCQSGVHTLAEQKESIIKTAEIVATDPVAIVVDKPASDANA